MIKHTRTKVDKLMHGRKRKHTEREQKVWNLYPVEILFKYILQVD